MKNKTFKKSISVFLSVLMILSCWVWTPLEHNHASAATTEVKVTTSFTLSPQGNRGATDWTRLALTGESSAGGTSVVLFRFTNDDLKQLAELDTVNLQFYAYSCNNRLSHNNVGVTVMADVYYITQNGSLVSAQGTNKNANVTDTGNAALGTNYTETYMQNHAKSYFGLSDSTLVGSFEQPAINGQDNESLRTGDVNCSYPVTDIVKQKADAGEDLSFIVMLRQGYSCSGDRGWSDVYINSDSIALSGYNAVDELKNRIEAYEEYFSNGIFYTNLQNNYKAYNDAKRYYDAVTYGGVQFDAAIAQNYISAIDTAIANTGFNETYIDYLNANITSRDGSSVSAAYRKNVIWYPWDFSWDITTNNARPEIQDTFFYFTMPNTIVGITNDSETTFPLHSFFWTTTDSRYVRYAIAGSGTASSGVVGSSDFATMAPWKISNDSNRHTTSGLAPGTDGFGGWVFEKNYRTDVTLDNAEDNSSNFAYSQDQVYQISSYAQINKNSIGVNATTTYKKVDQGFTFATSNSSNNGKTGYGNHYASNYSNYGGALHVVYMDTYKNNYENWKTLIPALSYKNYNGYVYSNAVNVTTNLDYASEIPLNLNLTEANRVGDISSTVTVWAQNINKGANDLKNAKAAGTTKVTTKYVDLINAIKNSEAAYADGSAKYTYASWKNFVAAYNAAKAHMASLDPSGSNVQYSSDATAIGNLASALDSARNALQVRTYDVTYENMFSFSNWVNSASGVIGTSAKGTMTYDVNAGTITVNNNAANTQSNPNDHYTSYGFGNGHYNMTLVPGETYTFEYTTSGGTADQVHIFFYDADGNAVANKANSGNPFAHAYGTGRGTHTISFTAPENATKAAFRFGTTVLGESVTFSDIFMYSHTRGDYADIANWTDRPNREVYTYNTALGTTLEVPTRPGYTFNGWWVDSINPNGQKDAGEQVTDGNGTVVADLQGFGITQDWVLYSEWTVNKYTVTWKNGDTVLETDTDVAYGSTPEYNGATPTKASDDDYDYTFKGWSPAIATVTGDVTYVAEFNAIAKTKYYTVTFKDWDGTVLSTQTVEEGTAATAPENPSRDYDDNNHYAFASWDKSFSNITADTEVTATYTTTAHSYNYVQNADGASHTGTCSCGKTVTGVCSGGTASCDKYAICKDCGGEYGDLTVHTEEIIPAVEATCTSTGLTAGKKCSVCGEILVEQTVVPKKAHTEDIIPAVESTCTKTGLTEGKKCSVCGTILVEQQTTDKKAHTMGDWITDTEPTCSTEGTKHRDCEVCGYTETETLTATGIHNFNADPQPKAGSQSFHDYRCATCDLRGVNVDGVPTLNMAEECYLNPTVSPINGNNSYHKETCVCGNTRDNVEHTLIDVEGTYVAPTCTAKGSQGKECTECGYTFTKELPEDANAHAYSEWIEKVPATCIATGTEGHYNCSLCNKNFDENKVEITDLTLGIDADAHTKLNKTDANPATCTDEGNIEYWTCEGCKKIYSDANAETEITEEETVIGKIAHNWIVATDSIDGFTLKSEADCVNEAVYYKNCSICKKSASEYGVEETFEYGDANGHVYGAWANDGVEDDHTGTHTKTCTVCSEDDGFDGYTVTEAHTWDAGVVTEEPSYTAAGVKTYTCTACPATYEEAIPANKDEIKPTVSIKWGTTVWNSILTTITFGRYVNYDINLEINAEDAETGIAKVEYLVSNTAIDDVTAVTEGWTSYDANNKLTIAKENEANYVVYARVTDNAGNVSYAGTDGFVLDITKPVITIVPSVNGNADTNVYCGNVTVTVTDNLDVTVTLNGEEEGSNITVSDAGNYTVVATDKAGNVSEVTFTVNADHTWDDGEVTDEPSCTEEGEKTYTCEVCGDTYTESVPMESHSYEMTDLGDGTHISKCSVCGAAEADAVAEAHTYTYADNADGTHTGTCSVCGATETDAHNFTCTDIVRPTLTDGTWTAGEYTYTCTDCNATKTEAAERADYSELEDAVAALEKLDEDYELTDDAKAEIEAALKKAEDLADNLVTTEQEQIDALVKELQQVKTNVINAVTGSMLTAPITDATSGLQIKFLKETGVDTIDSVQLKAGGGFDTVRLRLTSGNETLPITVTKVEADKAYIGADNTASSGVYANEIALETKESANLYIVAPSDFNETGIITYTITYKIGSDATGYLMNADGTPVVLQTKAYLYVKDVAVTPYHLMDEDCNNGSATSEWDFSYEATYGDFAVVHNYKAPKADFGNGNLVQNEGFFANHSEYDFEDDTCYAGCPTPDEFHPGTTWHKGDAHAATYRYYIDTSLAATWEDAGLRAKFAETTASNYDNAPFKYIRLANNQEYLDAISGADKTFSVTMVPGASSNVPTKTWTATSSGDLSVSLLSLNDEQQKDFVFGSHYTGDQNLSVAYANFSGAIPQNTTEANLMFSPRMEYNKAREGLLGTPQAEAVTMTTHLYITSYDKGELRAAVTAAEQAGYNANYYNAEKFAAYETALKNAKEVLGKAETNQNDVDAATTALNAAIADLARAEYVLTLTHSIHESADKNSTATGTNTEYYLLVGGSSFAVPHDADVIELDTINKYDDAVTLTINDTAEQTYNYWFIDYEGVDEAIAKAEEIIENADDYDEEFVNDVIAKKEALEDLINETNAPESQSDVDTALGNLTAVTDHECAYGDKYYSNGNGKDATHYQLCETCGAKSEAVGHVWGAGVEDPKADCENEGTMTYTCTANGCGATYTEEVEALGHEYGEWIAEIPATCVATGTKGHYHCAVCGVNFDADKNVLADLTLGIDADAHTKLNKTDANPATCTDEGNIEYWTCEGCGKIYTEEAATNEIELADTVIPATDHNWDAGVVTTEPTCTEDGVKTYTCQNANCPTKTKREAVPALKHILVKTEASA
ncbi:MAG: hypothetical protein IJO24_08145, partial [Clostridia bacterium]|nr:hypothetical protein [Clostridia bacterium]